WTLGHNKTPHQVAREFGHDQVLRLLMERTPPGLKLALAGASGDEQTFVSLLAERPDLVSLLSDDDQRKLVDAAQENDIKAVRTMLGSGWPADVRGQHGG